MAGREMVGSAGSRGSRDGHPDRSAGSTSLRGPVIPSAVSPSSGSSASTQGLPSNTARRWSTRGILAGAQALSGDLQVSDVAPDASFDMIRARRATRDWDRGPGRRARRRRSSWSTCPAAATVEVLNDRWDATLPATSLYRHQAKCGASPLPTSAVGDRQRSDATEWHWEADDQIRVIRLGSEGRLGASL